jgi:hypothetical protein
MTAKSADLIQMSTLSPEMMTKDTKAASNTATSTLQKMILGPNLGIDRTPFVNHKPTVDTKIEV